MHLDDAGDFPFTEVGQGDVVAEQKGQPAVVVLEIQRLPHARGKLIDEAEDAFVAAGVLLVHQIGFKLQSDVVVGVLFAQMDCAGATGALQLQQELLFRQIKAVVQHIRNGVAVDGEQCFPRLNAVAPGQASVLYSGDGYRHAFSLPCDRFHVRREK